MEKDSASINHYYGMVFQNCNMSNASIQTINQAIPPQQAHAPAAGEGQSSFASLVTHPEKAEAVIRKLHELVDRQTKAKEVVKPVRAAMDAGVLGRPTWRQFCTEFGPDKLKSSTSLSSYTEPGYQIQDGDFKEMVRMFQALIE